MANQQTTTITIPTQKRYEYWKYEMKKAADCTDVHPSVIYSTVLSKADASLYSALPSEETCKRVVI